MLLVMDVGNTNTVIGVHDGESFICDFRIRTEPDATTDEFNVMVSSLLKEKDIGPDSISRIIVSSVVPPMVDIISNSSKKYFNIEPFFVDAATYTGMPILYKNPGDVGADRIVNSVAALGKLKTKTSMIIIDFGTATTFDAISQAGEYMGGAISPGLSISAEALYKKAAKLPRVEISKPPESVIGQETSKSIQAGIIFGYAGLVDGIVNRMKKELMHQPDSGQSTEPKVIATGGLAGLMMGVSETIDEVDNFLTLEGLLAIDRETIGKQE